MGGGRGGNCEPHMPQSGTTGESDYEPHVKGGVSLCGREHACVLCVIMKHMAHSMLMNRGLG